ncbi:hypothetical protein CI109_104448 [Kwoniella shandongensis]|uniref:Xylanolytic transcriptional activator regulatory domain-containing protein n=1 Tax=Kwoniella shandongensis TaxID=1734106 RepID=A0AAJ8MXU3_9TREE
MRGYLLEIIEVDPNPSIQTFQTFFLSNYFVVSDVKMYHSAGVTAARLRGIFNGRKNSVASEDLPTFVRWCLWAEDQERTRLAWMIFTLDTFNALVLRHSVMLQSYDQWTATSPGSWEASHVSSSPGQAFRPTLKLLVEEHTLSPTIAPYSIWALLHACVSLTWALSTQGTDCFTLARRAQITVWKSNVYNALLTFQYAMMGSLQAQDADIINRTLAYSGVPLASICVIVLMTDLDAVRVLAGAEKLNGRDITEEDRVEARQSLESWAQSTEGRQSCWCAIGLELPVDPRRGIKPHHALNVVVHSLIEEQPINSSTSLISPNTKCRVEATLARRSALRYLERVLACKDPVNLPAVSNLNECTSLVAYAAHLCGSLEWGSLGQPTRVLYSLLKSIELAQGQYFVDC